MVILLIILLIEACFVLSGKRNGSLVSLDDYMFSSSNQFYSKYFKDFDESLDLKLATTFVKKIESEGKVYIRGEPKENLTLMRLDDSGETYLSHIEISKEKDKSKLSPLTPGIDYYVDYISETPVISDLNLDYAPYLKNLNSTYDIRCSSRLKAISFDSLKANHKSWKLKKIDLFSKDFSFALLKENDSTEYKFRRIKFSEDKANNSDIELTHHDFEANDEIFDLKNVENFWILKPNNNLFTHRNNSKDIPSLALSTRDYIYLFTCDNEKIILHSKVNYKEQIPGGATLQDFNITKIGLWNDILILGTFENGLNFFKRGQDNVYTFHKARSNFFGKKDRMLYNFRIKDFVINSDTIYCIVNGFGMKIYSLKYDNLTDFEFHHPYLVSFDHSYSINNLDQEHYRGILIDNSQQGVPEFLMELNIQKEEAPLINKLYSYSRALDSVNMVYDNKYTYLFDNYSRILFMIKRSMDPLSPSLIYKIDLSKNFLNEEKKYSIVDLSYGKRLFFLDIDNNYIDDNVLISEITAGGSTVSCTFDDPGVYVVRYSYNGINKNVKDSSERNLTTDDVEVANFVHTEMMRIEVQDKNLLNYALFGIFVGLISIFIILMVYFTIKKKKRNETMISKKEELPERMPQPYEQTDNDNAAETNRYPSRGEEMVIEMDDKILKKKFADY